jgi:hypothetical protein
MLVYFTGAGIFMSFSLRFLTGAELALRGLAYHETLQIQQERSASFAQMA